MLCDEQLKEVEHLGPLKPSAELPAVGATSIEPRCPLKRAKEVGLLFVREGHSAPSARATGSRAR
jgi:hypothetical protein